MHRGTGSGVGWTFDLLPGDVPQKCRQRAAELGAWSPGPSHVVVTSQLPIGQIPWGLPGQMASLPHPARAYPAPAPGVHQLSFAWRSYLLASSELAAPPQSPSPPPRHLALPQHFRGSLFLLSLSIVERALALQTIKSCRPVFNLIPAPL